MIIKNEQRIQKITLIKDGGVTVEYSDRHPLNKNVDVLRKDSVKAKPTTEFESAWGDLVQFYMAATGLSEINSLIAYKGAGDTAPVKSAIKQVLREISKRCDVRSINFTYNESGMVGCLITGTFTNYAGDVVSKNTPYIHLDRDAYGFEKDLRGVIGDVTEQTMEFLKGRFVQLTIPFDEPVIKPTVEKKNKAAAENKKKGGKQLSLDTPPADKPQQEETLDDILNNPPAPTMAVVKGDGAAKKKLPPKKAAAKAAKVKKPTVAGKQTPGKRIAVRKAG